VKLNPQEGKTSSSIVSFSLQSYLGPA